MGHIDALYQAASFTEIWRVTRSRIQTREEMRAYIEEALRMQAEGTALPFATCHRRSGKVVGSTRFANIDASHRGVEIGGTWITPAFQRTAINTEAKYLMLRHAFENMGCIRVMIKTDQVNEQSQRAIERIGAKREGILRNHMIVAGGRIRNSVIYSVITEDWPQTRQHLESLLEKQYATA